MGRRKINSFQQIEDKVTKSQTFNKRKKGLIKKAMELSILCGQDVMLVIHNQENQKLVVYQSKKEFNGEKVSELLSSQYTKNRFYEEHTNADFDNDGYYKQQTFNLRLDGDGPARESKYNGIQKLYWKIKHQDKYKEGQTQDQQLTPNKVQKIEDIHQEVLAETEHKLEIPQIKTI